MKKLLNISELSRILNLVDPITKKPLNHVLRYWEKEFIQLKPKKINQRRYYSEKDVEIIKIIKFLLKDSKMTIAGAKNILNLNRKKLDGSVNNSLINKYYKSALHQKSILLLKKIIKLKNNGKKISS